MEVLVQDSLWNYIVSSLVATVIWHNNTVTAKTSHTSREDESLNKQHIHNLITVIPRNSD